VTAFGLLGLGTLRSDRKLLSWRWPMKRASTLTVRSSVPVRRAQRAGVLRPPQERLAGQELLARC
jgi:hypothetical protein